jgi:type II secretory pathway component PulF
MTDRKPSFVVTALLVAAGVLLWLGLWFQVLVLTPALKRRYDEFGMQLPAVTQQTIALSQWAQDFGLLVLPAALAAAVVCGGVLGWLRHRRGWTAAVTLLAVLVLAGLTITNLVVAAGLLLPEVKLQEGLRK